MTHIAEGCLQTPEVARGLADYMERVGVRGGVRACS